jgi:opacity protein-like surface antigen
MRLKRCFWLSLAVIFVCSDYFASAQVVPATTANQPAATAKQPVWALGAGLSGYHPIVQTGHLLGGTLWIDYSPNWVPSFLQGIGLEAEARDLNYGRASTVSPNLREDTAEGGVIYSWPHYRKLHPYGKFLMGYGNVDQMVYGARHHDSRTLAIWGGGVDYKVSRNIWVRADYEHQEWPDTAYRDVHGISTAYEPRYCDGLTIGALYHFGIRNSN